ncbi:transcription factor bHLH121 [Humulus lupulus]|uniref:transcription factor bHLH121 n=1 Tax=Humulus lupulus TaxID=3486 RepID=UPI002B41286B|nr:transcription factor bHLH121 [Humulus lupulus]XP_062082301.1 transcription factor bHLH121 [Humulus lupulus]XP_062082305.1 transcription factor bHLH121 [Humulus lupulus]
MNQLQHDEFIQSPNPPSDPRLPSTSVRSQPSSSQRPEGETKDGTVARKLQKADREKLRRDRLNEHFIELGSVLDPDRPKNDKATILTDTIQLLKDLTSQVDKLKAEYTMLNEESRELTLEKNDLREEKTSLKSDIENLNVQCQQRVRTMFPWAAMDHSVVMAPTSYPYPVPMPMPQGPIPMHPHMQPYPYYGNQNPGVIPNPCSTFVPYITPTTLVEQQSQQYVTPIVQPVSRSNVSGKQDSRNKSSGESKIEKSEDSSDVATNLELKTPGSATDQDSGQGQSQRYVSKENKITERSSSSRCSSSRSVQDSSSNSIVSSRKANNRKKD